MPEVHRDHRRVITEEWCDGVRYTRIDVTAAGLPLGNHWHDEAEQFYGVGEGTLYVCNADSPDQPLEEHALPANGWEVIIPGGVTHTFVFSGATPVLDEAIAVLLSETTWELADSGPNANTHQHILVK